MKRRSRFSALSSIGGLLSAVLVGLLTIPLLALMLSSSPESIQTGLSDPQFFPALFLSLKTSMVSLAITILFGTPLAWHLASSTSIRAKIASVVVELPIVTPPAVVGVALLTTFGQGGWFGELNIPFTTLAVIIAQTVVSAPFYVQAAVNAFSKIDEDTLIVARTLGSTETRAFFRVVLPIAGPGLLIGASLAWARALGEFGATLLFAGNMPEKTQTMPLAIFSALESDVSLAVVYAMALAAMGVLLIVGLRVIMPRLMARQRDSGI